jgi:hypothetical protein
MDRETETIDDVFKRFLAGKKATIVFSQPSVSFKVRRSESMGFRS